MECAEFFYTGEMPAFDAKTYQRDLAVMHLRKGPVLLVFPNGASLDDPTGILEGKYTDGRRMLTLRSEEEVDKCKAALGAMVRKWAEGINALR